MRLKRANKKGLEAPASNPSESLIRCLGDRLESLAISEPPAGLKAML